ncbi:MAG: DNA mismatch repair endonuclease MutL [Deltaproteobacteria bacterium]
MPLIQVLPPGLVNQIAAGEVVERPASVVKELVENALDAGARSIQVDLEEGGLALVRVADDGSGMEREDAVLSLERHATSKLRDAGGLTTIGTMGFRGEAIPAIASVARMRIDTCPDGKPGSAVGTRISVEGGDVTAVEEVARARGTTIEVRDLFFNTPARRKFMRSTPAESGHCSEAVVRACLARTDVGFTLRSGGRISIVSPAGASTEERAAVAIGREAARALIPVDQERGGVRVHGAITSPDHSAATGRGLYLFVNGRFIRDRALAWAVVRAYAGSLPAGRQPAGVLYLELPLDRVDVNVHPQKLEVRFQDARAATDALHHAVSEALRPSPWLRHAAPGASPIPAVPIAAEPRGDDVADVLSRARAAGGLSCETPPSNSSLPFPVELPRGTAQAEPPSRAVPGYFGSLRYIGPFARTYLVCEAPGGALVVVDQHASHERVLFHRLRESLRARKLEAQPFLVPPVVTLPTATARTVEGALAELAQVGLEVEPFGGDSFAVKSAPAVLGGTAMGPLLGDLAAQLAEAGTSSAVTEALDGLLATMACHAAVRANQDLTREEVRALLDGLDSIDFKARCPHGRPVVAELPIADLERRVGRR